MKKLSEKQIKAVQYIVQGYSQTDVAGMVDVRRETVNRWTKLPEFIEAVDKVKTDLQEASQMILQNLHEKVFKTHIALLDASSEKVRLDAVKAFQQMWGLYKNQTELTITDKTKQMEEWLSSAEKALPAELERLANETLDN